MMPDIPLPAALHLPALDQVFRVNADAKRLRTAVYAAAAEETRRLESDARLMDIRSRLPEILLARYPERDMQTLARYKCARLCREIAVDIYQPKAGQQVWDQSVPVVLATPLLLPATGAFAQIGHPSPEDHPDAATPLPDDMLPWFLDSLRLRQDFRAAQGKFVKLCESLRPRGDPSLRPRWADVIAAFPILARALTRWAKVAQHAP